jgi:hypothetical protein
VAPVRALAPLNVVEPPNVTVPVDESDVAVTLTRLVDPDVCERLPAIVTLLGVPIDDRELLVTVVRRLVDVNT